MDGVKIRIRRPEKPGGTWRFQIEEWAGGTPSVYRGRGDTAEAARDQALSRASDQVNLVEAGRSDKRMTHQVRGMVEEYRKKLDDIVPF